MKYVGKGAAGKLSPKEFRILVESGVFNDIGLDSGSGYDRNRGYSGSSFRGLAGLAIKQVDRFGNYTMGAFQKVDTLCRIGTVLAAYDKAISEGKSREEAIEYAKDINRKANFDYGVHDAPNIFRRGSIFSQIMLQFKKYAFKEMEIIGDMFPGSSKTTMKQKMMFWGIYFLTCGLMGIPLLDWLDDMLGERTGFFPKDFIQKSIMEVAGTSEIGKAIASMAMYGILAGANINISNRASLADVIPTRTSDFAGPSLSKLYNLASDMPGVLMGDGNAANAIRNVSPGIYNLIAAYTGEAYGSRDRLNTRYETTMDRILRAMGFKSVDESIPADIQRIVYNEREKTKKEKQRAIDAYIKNPNAENKKKLDDLKIKMDTVKKEVERKNADRIGRTEAGLTKDEKEKNRRLLDFAK